MICPCCGGEMLADGLSCSCGAKVVGPPLAKPEYMVAQVGLPVIAILLAIISLPAFIWKWLLSFSLFALIVSIKALKRIKRAPQQFGGRRTALTALVLSSCTIIAVSAYIIVGIPKYLYWRAESERAATRAQMYRVAIALHSYKQKNGAYPADLQELQIDQVSPLLVTDLWENRLNYRPTAEVAIDSQNEVNKPVVFTSFNQYQLVSPGPDAKLGTDDDMIMRDDIIISPKQANISDDEEMLEE